jgi:hypothetical protein
MVLLLYPLVIGSVLDSACLSGVTPVKSAWRSNAAWYCNGCAKSKPRRDSKSQLIARQHLPQRIGFRYGLAVGRPMMVLAMIQLPSGPFWQAGVRLETHSPARFDIL